MASESGARSHKAKDTLTGSSLRRKRIIHGGISHFSKQEKIINIRYVLTLCTALVIGGTLITGSASARGMADEKTPMADSWITAKSKIALFADS
ncbi:MAG: hypothetical protein ABI618_19355, partial [Nitrospirota bacterium]